MLFIIELTYITSTETINKHLVEHRVFLDHHYQAGCFLLSGRKNPRTGGYILATADSKAELEAALQNDPFYTHKIAEYTITAFEPSKANERLAFLLEN